MAHNHKFAHIAVRFPPEISTGIDSERLETKARSTTAIVRTRLTGRLPHWRADMPIRPQSVTSPRTDLWLPRTLVASLRTLAADLDINMGDLVVSMVATDPRQHRATRAA